MLVHSISEIRKNKGYNCSHQNRRNSRKKKKTTGGLQRRKIPEKEKKVREKEIG